MDTYELTIDTSNTLKVDFHRASQNRQEITILYFHGGGLLYGTRDDLPSRYMAAFLNQGYDVLCMDYPLAPESSLSRIHNTILASLRWFLENKSELLNTGENGYYLFGRSAGAYLALYLAHNALRNNLPSPRGLLCFYGYSSLDVAEFSTPNAFYAKFMHIDDSIMEKFSTDKSFVTNGPLQERYLLYVYARQTGRWIELLCRDEVNDEKKQYSLTPDDLAKLPPAFFTASSTDQDVPFRCSKKMSRQIPGSRFYAVYNLEHDFDRDTSRPEGNAAYQAALSWMEEQNQV